MVCGREVCISSKLLLHQSQNCAIGHVSVRRTVTQLKRAGWSTFLTCVVVYNARHTVCTRSGAHTVCALRSFPRQTTACVSDGVVLYVVNRWKLHTSTR